MSKTIYLATDLQCWTERKIKENIMGGAEMFFLRLRKWLLENNYQVHDPVLNPLISGQPDLTIHSNTYDFRHHGRKNLLWCGSWHASVRAPVDEIIVISEFMRRELVCDQAVVIPAPYDASIDRYKGSDYVPGSILTSSNPNRHIRSTKRIAQILKDRNVSFSWQCTGGNKLYSDNFGECFNFIDPNLIYRGLLSYHDLIGLLSSSHMWAYAAFEDTAETQCVSILEAAVLGLPIIAPRKEPFISILPQAFFVDTEEEMADKIQEILTNGPHRIDYDVKRYSEDFVMPQILDLVKRLLEEK